METVAIRGCDSYEYEKVKKVIYETLDEFPEIGDRAKKGAKALVKTNLLMKKQPQEGVTTHPSVVEAIVSYLMDKGCQVTIGDSPGGPFTTSMLKSVYKASGMDGVAQRTGCSLNFDISAVEVSNPSALKLKTVRMINAVREADFVISAAKLKTHGMMTYTGAVKNLFGVIPGLIKAEYHFKMISEMNFAHHLVDICETVKPLFSVIDAIEGMEGNGPSGGEVRHVGLLMASMNPYALDVTAARIIGMKPSIVPTIRAAHERRLFQIETQVAVKGIPLDEINIEKFKLPDSVKGLNFIKGMVPEPVEKVITSALKAKPVFEHATCIGCRDCARICPAGIIDMSSGKPVPDLDRCISCFCCHEVCPVKAVSIKRHPLQRLLFKG